MNAIRQRLNEVPYKYLVAAAFIFGLFMDILDTTIVNVALPRLVEEFHATTDTLEWVVTGYLLSLAVWIPASGWLGDRFGTKRIFLFATFMFVLGSALCGSAWNIGSLVLFRVVQGVGGGMMTPVGTAMLFRAFTPQERAQAAAILGIPTQIAPMLGPLLGGFLVDKVNWRWIFYVNLPIGAASFLFSALALREHREEHAGRFDPWGFVFSGLGLAGILYALSRGPDDGWTSINVLAPALLGVIAFVLLVVFETRNPEPMLDLSLYRIRMFRQANLTAFCMFSAQLGILFLMPLFLQELRGLSAFDSGLITFAQPLAAMAMVQVTSRLYSRFGLRRYLLVSTFGVVLTSVLLMLVDLQTNLWWIRGIMFLRGVFLAFNMVSVQTAIFSNISRDKTGRASSLSSIMRQTSSAFGVAILGTVLISRMKALTPSGATGAAASNAGLLAFHDAFAGAAILALIAVFFAWNIHDRDVHGAPSPRVEEPVRGAPEARIAAAT
ncbi:MAG: DHA2 family efflux MFS transporter permease subunit [Chloroflexi bacterium]|nr:DHA2 family efflux MFS transporter permease subunit [Chloroflexota bacterium]